MSYVQVGRYQTIEIGIELLQQSFVLLEACGDGKLISLEPKVLNNILTSHEQHRFMRVEARHQRHFVEPSFLQNLLGVFRQERLVVLSVELSVRLQIVLNRWHKGEAHVFTAVIIVDCLWGCVDYELWLNFSQKLCENQIKSAN